jgi:Polysaccharide deacetylase
VSAWLDSTRQALAEATKPVTFFIRDDDVGWADEQLFALLDLFAEVDLPIDLAVIPRALTPRLARHLQHRRQHIDVHQHGYAHVNYEPEGRKCEFGPGRSRARQRMDIARGQQRLRALLGPSVRPIFTPPWNRCTPDTAACLFELCFVALSRDISAGRVAVAGLTELPVGFDWFAKRKGSPLSRDERGDLLAQQIRTATPVGIMLHHAPMDADDLAVLRELLVMLADHRIARVSSMWRLLPPPQSERVIDG